MMNEWRNIDLLSLTLEDTAPRTEGAAPIVV
jgi:hypothetical protein